MKALGLLPLVQVFKGIECWACSPVPGTTDRRETKTTNIAVVEQNTGKDNQEAKAETIRMTNDRSDLIEGNMGLSCNVFNVVSHGTVYKYCL